MWSVGKKLQKSSSKQSGDEDVQKYSSQWFILQVKKKLDEIKHIDAELDALKKVPCVCVCVCVCVSYIHVHACARAFVCIYTHAYIYIYIYIYTSL
jgi:hypothetical protein